MPAADSNSANAALLTFPYYRNYVDLVKMELNAIASVTKGAKPRKYAVLGSGPLPMTSICILRALRNDGEAVTVDNFDYDPWAISESSKLRCHTGYSQEEIDHHYVDVESEDYDLRSFHIVYLASLVGITTETKQRTIIRIMKQMRPGALLVLRSAHSLRSLLYPVRSFQGFFDVCPCIDVVAGRGDQHDPDQLRSDTFARRPPIRPYRQFGGDLPDRSFHFSNIG